MLVAWIALVTSSIHARPVVMAGVIGGITAVESTVPAIRAPSIVLPHDAVSAGIWVAATSCVTGSIGASRLCGAIIDVMNVPTAVEALNPADVSAGLANIARKSVKYRVTSAAVPAPAAQPTVAKIASHTACTSASRLVRSFCRLGGKLGQAVTNSLKNFS